MSGEKAPLLQLATGQGMRPAATSAFRSANAFWIACVCSV